MKWIIPRFVYQVYERKLGEEIRKKPIPQHIGVILDGNRRGSKILGLGQNEGYELGAKKLEEVLNWAWELGVKIVSCWVFSTENFHRPKEQVDTIMKLALEKLQLIQTDKRVKEHKLKIKIIGRRSMLSEEIRKEIEYVEELTKNNEQYQLNICMAYGGRAEILDAIKGIAKKVSENEITIEDINEDLVSENLYTNGLPDPELIIRTSGEERLSGFLLWQSAYSELYFEEAYWPLFRKIDFWRAIRIYQQRSRRFGK